MPNILNIGLSGLLTFQRALAVTSHNVSNVNTEGYTRQRPDLQALAGQQFGNGYFGRGVEISDVHALSNRFVESRLTEAITDNGRTARFAELSARLDDLLAELEELKFKWALERVDNLAELMEALVGRTSQPMQANVD